MYENVQREMYNLQTKLVQFTDQREKPTEIMENCDENLHK